MRRWSPKSARVDRLPVARSAVTSAKLSRLVDLVGDAPDRRRPGRSGTCALPTRAPTVADDLVAAEDVRPPVFGRPRSSRARRSRPSRRRRSARCPVRGVGRLGELDVVGDHLRAVPASRSMTRAKCLRGNGHRPFSPAAVEVAERDRRRPRRPRSPRAGCGAADREPRVDRVELEPAEDVRPVCEEAKPVDARPRLRETAPPVDGLLRARHASHTIL